MGAEKVTKPLPVSSHACRMFVLATLACSYIRMVKMRLLHPKRRQSVVECVLWKISIGYCRMQVGLLKDMFFIQISQNLNWDLS